MAVFTDPSNASDLTMVIFTELNGEVADGNGYTQGGQQLSNIIWDVADTPSEMRFTCDALTCVNGGAKPGHWSGVKAGQ
jgi:hypothetical protein